MGGPGDPPEGTPEGAPAGGEDEYRSVVFDESFVRAAQLQEYSARERIGDHAPAVRRRPPPLRRGLTRQVLFLVLLIMIAFGTAIYMGVRNPYQSPAARRAVEPLRMTVVPLAPQAPVPGADEARVLYAHSPAAHFKTGADGVTLPAARRTAHFSESQVVTALTTAKEYIVRSALYPEVLFERQTRAARVLLHSDQLDQFDASFTHPSADGLHAPTGWLVRFDPGQVRLADPGIRVRGTLGIAETDAATLEVTADHTFVYALSAAQGTTPVSLFTVRRELHFRFDHDDLRLRQTQLLLSSAQAGPLSCSTDTVGYLHPLLAGQTAGTAGPAGTDPYSTGSTAALCGTLAGGALPKV
ncbi:hypothetical protein IAG44_27255 [Streptomyces roseirectus]|uniref:Uncharacterized protein n=1 Tax=Streptomyces roseirectus TaxID=2768066 RepID=A0A7H0IIZ4_9ACTN|nr:hypothetical protein [Streptomyces roseirectus]QNP72760.1 hypothetical protein IAG44_27255 [Streptomyces roseirectus]